MIRRCRKIFFFLPIAVGVLAFTSLGAAPAAMPRIANGVYTQAYPAVGMLLLSSDGVPDGSCSGTMVGCDTFITAAHCLCINEADDAAQCLAGGLIAPADLMVYLPQGGLLPVRAVEISPDYNFGIAGDIAVVKLDRSMSGIAPLPINRTKQPPFGSGGILVGFGANGINSSVGIKQSGKVTVAACSIDHPNDRHVCFSFLEPQGPPGSNSDTCEGDSGGPLLIDFGGGDTLAGTTSGGSNDTCLPPDDSFNTDVFFYRDFIAGIAGSDLDNTQCGNLPRVGSAEVTEAREVGNLSSMGERSYTFEVPIGSRLLRVGLNGDSGESRRGNDFDLLIRNGAAPTSELFDCRGDSELPIEFCEVNSPQPGTWNLLVQSFRGQGNFQLTATAFAGCIADCDADGSIRADDLQTVIEVALGQKPIIDCGGGDANGDGVVSIEDVILALAAAAGSCGEPSL